MIKFELTQLIDTSRVVIVQLNSFCTAPCALKSRKRLWIKLIMDCQFIWLGPCARRQRSCSRSWFVLKNWTHLVQSHVHPKLMNYYEAGLWLIVNSSHEQLWSKLMVGFVNWSTPVQSHVHAKLTNFKKSKLMLDCFIRALGPYGRRQSS